MSDFSKEILEMCEKRDDFIEEIIDNCDIEFVKEHTHLKELIEDNEYLDACEKFEGEVFIYATFNNIQELWVNEGELQKVKDYIKPATPRQVLYILPADLGIVQLYLLDDLDTINYLREKYKNIYQIILSKTKK